MFGQVAQSMKEQLKGGNREVNLTQFKVEGPHMIFSTIHCDK